MTAVTVTSGSIKLHSSGDQTKVVMDITNVVNGYTLTVNHLRTIEDYNFSCTTEADIGITVSGNTLTFVTSSTLAAKLVVYGR